MYYDKKKLDEHKQYFFIIQERDCGKKLYEKEVRKSADKRARN